MFIVLVRFARPFHSPAYQCVVDEIMWLQRDILLMMIWKLSHGITILKTKILTYLHVSMISRVGCCGELPPS
ncbi:hypothetical protein Syun_004078 [Stephania yunnanensis]|uniref:Uncharacterized protein n=1 Tax=Stephania yunnanensis TaxID=152371 RepID=A0AAP0L2F8_9MAGN